MRRWSVAHAGRIRYESFVNVKCLLFELNDFHGIRSRATLGQHARGEMIAPGMARLRCREAGLSAGFPSRATGQRVRSTSEPASESGAPGPHRALGNVDTGLEQLSW